MKKKKKSKKAMVKRKFQNKISFQQENIDTYSNICTNINTDCNNKLNISQPTAIILNNTNSSSLQPLFQTGDNHNQYKNKIDYKTYTYIKKNKSRKN